MGEAVGDIDFVRVLGPVQAVTRSGPVDLPSATQRRLLALLALHAPRSLRMDLLCDVLAVSPGALRTTVSRVRKVLGDGSILASQGGYRLDVPVDAGLFAALLPRLVSDDDRIGTLEQALAMWAGPPFDEFSAEAWARPGVARLTELHASATEDHADELIAVCRWSEAIAELQGHVAAHPLRDRPRRLLMQALAGAGRQADALRAFQEYRAYLAESVGTEPSGEVRRIERQIATGWNGRAETLRGAPFARPATTQHPVGSVGWFPLPDELANGPALVGRVRELGLLAADLARVSGSGLRTVVVEGEAGMGKTTLLAGFARSARDLRSAAVLYGRCPDGLVAPLQPFRSLLEHVVEHTSVDVLQAHTSYCGGQLTRIAPRLADRVAVPDTALTGDDAWERHSLFEAVGDVLRRVAELGPLAILLDDLQWAEPTALDLLRHLGRALVDVPVLIVLSARDIDERSATLLRTVVADLERGPSRRMTLSGFDNDELADLMASLVTVEGVAVTSTVSARLRDQTAGNPLYATQLVRHWAESGRLVLDAPEVDFVEDAADDDVPASLRDLLWSRVNALGDDVLQVLSAAAVIGVEFAEDAVIDMVGMPETVVLDALDAAERAGLLVDAGSTAPMMRFVHVLVATAVYSELPARRQRRLHARAARVLEKRSDAPTGQLAALLARQCALGGLLAEAQRWATSAGDHAAAQLSAAEAARWYRTALDHAATLGAPERERADLLARLGHAQRQGNDPDALRTLTEAATLARHCGASAIVVQAALATDRGFLRLGPVAPAQLAILEAALELVDEDATRARLLALLAEALGPEPAGTRRTELARQAVALADAGSDPTLLARICSSVVYALWGPSHEATELRADVARRSIVAARTAGDPDLEFAVHAAAYTVAIQLADPTGAARSLQRLHELADEIGAPHMTWTVGYYEAFVATMEARFVDAEQLARATMEVGLALGGADGVTVFAGQAAVLATIAGHQSELPPEVMQAIEAGPVQLTLRLAHAIVSVANGPRGVAGSVLAEAAAAGFGHVPPDHMWMTSMLGYAILAIELEDIEAAAPLLSILEPYAGQVTTNLGPAGAYVGRLASLLGRHDLAEQHLTAAFEIADAFDWDYYRATTLMALAAGRRRRLGELDGPARASLAAAERICIAQNLPKLRAGIHAIRETAVRETALREDGPRAARVSPPRRRDR